MSGMMSYRALRRRLQATCCSCICAMIAPWDRCALAIYGQLGASPHRRCLVHSHTYLAGEKLFLQRIAIQAALEKTLMLKGSGTVREAGGQAALQVDATRPASSRLFSVLRLYAKGLHIETPQNSLQVVALCNQLVDRVPRGTQQSVRANLRPVSLTTPLGRLDWDPAGEVIAVRLDVVAPRPHHAKLSSLWRSYLRFLTIWLMLTFSCSSGLNVTHEAIVLWDGNV